jgi:hypothetical protein
MIEHWFFSISSRMKRYTIFGEFPKMKKDQIYILDNINPFLTNRIFLLTALLFHFY